MSVDRTKPVTPLAVAVAHYHKVILGKIVVAWFSVVRERGKVARYKDRIFYAWKAAAPKWKRTRIFQEKATDWIRLKQLKRAYSVMIALCQRVIGKRTEKMKVSDICVYVYILFVDRHFVLI
jgi:hypothetical protein